MAAGLCSREKRPEAAKHRHFLRGDFCSSTTLLYVIYINVEREIPREKMTNYVTHGIIAAKIGFVAGM